MARPTQEAEAAISVDSAVVIVDSGGGGGDVVDNVDVGGNGGHSIRLC